MPISSQPSSQPSTQHDTDQKNSTPAFVPAKRVQNFSTTVFAEFTPLANRHNAVNLGQGFPNFPAPDFIKDAAQQAIAADMNQYTRSEGHPPLVEALASIYSPLFERALDPLKEIVVTNGATEALFATLQAIIEPGDEVIIIEPFYDSYAPDTIMAGGTPVFVPLRQKPNATNAADWVLDWDELEAAFTERTRLLVINTPLNPIGKVFSRAELEKIAALVIERDIYVLSDEAYEWMVYSDDTRSATHVRIATLPGMWERTISVGSAGKTFSVTGWKVGWAIASAPIAHAIFMAHQWIPFTVPTPLQEGVAVAFQQAPARDYFNELQTMYQGKRDYLLAVLDKVGLKPIVPDGAYFILVDTSELDVPVPPNTLRDWAVCRWLTSEVGVAAIPPSAFYSPPNQQLADNLARFCFCKTDEMLHEAARRLETRL